MGTHTGRLKEAFTAFQGGRYEEAETICRELLPDGPGDGEVFFLLGLISNKTGRHAESVQWLGQAAEIQPPSVRLFSALGGAHHAAGDLPLAAKCFAHCIQLDPGCAEAYYQLGNVCCKLRAPEKAVRLYQKATQLDPQNYKLWNNLASALRDMGRIEESLAAYDRALAICPDCPLTRANRGIALLTAGNLEEGFREYGFRWQPLELRKYPQPVWKGEPISDKTLYVFAEQGLGDTIQFVRYLRLARERAGRIVLECQASLKILLEQSHCADVIVATGETPPAFDCYSPLLDLPEVFRTTLDTIPADVPYLMAGSGEEPLTRDTVEYLKVGLAWAGNPDFQNDDMRSIPLRELSLILNVPGVVFFSLQLNVPACDQAHFRSLPNMVGVSERIKDFRHTAAIINQMDLVVSVDTAVAHLAGALAKPVWTFICRSPDWRWMLNRTDSPWYPTMRLFRQPQSGSWQPAIAQAAAELQKMVAASLRQ